MAEGSKLVKGTKRVYVVQDTHSGPIESLGSNNSLSSVVSIKTDPQNEEQFDSNHRHNLKEKWWSLTIQVAIPFVIAGMGTIGAGVVLGNVQVRST